MNRALEFPSYHEVHASLARGGAGVDVAELHGLMVGLLSAGGSLSGNDWPERLHVNLGPDALSEGGTLDQLRIAAASALADPDFGFAPLLPEEDAPLAQRAAALFIWCHGFLAGFSLGPDRAPLSEEAQEAFNDLAEIAAFVADDDEQDEQALTEVTEFVRVAALLIRGDVLAETGPSKRLH